jgi:hypothetical protein
LEIPDYNATAEIVAHTRKKRRLSRFDQTRHIPRLLGLSTSRRRTYEERKENDKTN